MTSREIPGGVSLELPGRTIPKERRLFKNPDVAKEHNLEDLIKAAGGDEQLASIMREHVREEEEKRYYSVIGAMGSMMVAPEISDLFERVMELEAKKWLKEEYGAKADELAPEKLEVKICGKIPLLTATGEEKKPEGTLVDRSRRIVEYLIKTGRDGSFESDPEGVYEAITGGEKISVEEVREKEVKEPVLEPEEPEKIEVKAEVEAPVKEPEPEEEGEQPQEEEPVLLEPAEEEPQEPESEGEEEREVVVEEETDEGEEISLGEFLKSLEEEEKPKQVEVEGEDISEPEPPPGIVEMPMEVEEEQPEEEKKKPVLARVEEAINSAGEFNEVLNKEELVEIALDLLPELFPQVGISGPEVVLNDGLVKAKAKITALAGKIDVGATAELQSDEKGKLRLKNLGGISGGVKAMITPLLIVKGHVGSFDGYVNKSVKNASKRLSEFLNDKLELEKKVKSVEVRFLDGAVRFTVKA